MDMAARFLFGTLAVEVHEAGQDVFVSEIRGPAVGVGHGSVNLVMKVFQGADETLLMNLLILAVYGLSCLEFYEHVINLGQSEVGMGGLLALAVGVEFLAQLA